MMKRLLTTLIVAMMTFVAMAQTPATLKFLGIPVDGSKTEMIRQLRQKGFAYDAKEDLLTGTFNGMESNVRIHENNGKVDRVYIADANTCNEAQIRIRFNNLLQQFKANEKYVEMEENKPISEKEDISYEMTVNSKNYDAAFYLNPTYGFSEEDNVRIATNLAEELQAKIDAGEYEDMTDEKSTEILQTMAVQKLISMIEGQVWFRIAKYYGDYYLTIYYDNLKNRPNGEDL